MEKWKWEAFRNMVHCLGIEKTIEVPEGNSPTTNPETEQSFSAKREFESHILYKAHDHYKVLYKYSCNLLRTFQERPFSEAWKLEEVGDWCQFIQFVWALLAS